MIYCSQCPGYNSKLRNIKQNSPFLKEKTINGDYHTTISKLVYPCLKKSFNEQKDGIETIKKEPNENSEIEKKILKLKIQSLKMPLTPTELGVLGRSSDELQSGVNYSKSSGKLLKRISLF